MDTLTFKDLTRPQSMRVLEQCRVQYYGRERFERDAADDDLLEEVYQTVGGRIALLNKVCEGMSWPVHCMLTKR
jgi:hypothetical protein